MKIRSFISDHKKLIPVEVELTLWPGLPTIQFLGLPDQHLRESALRIKSAIKAQGYEFPKAKQILVNLRPSHLKKTSRGLELAVAAAYLWETGQAAVPISGQEFFVYGELSLSGEVFEPEDLPNQIFPSSTVLTGTSSQNNLRNYTRQALASLADIEAPQNILPNINQRPPFLRPPLPSLYFSKQQAQLIEMISVGEHSCLIAGPAGSGKTTLAKALHGLLREPSSPAWSEVIETQKKFGFDICYPPIVKPHHTTPQISMVGGGSVPLAGEISRAHGGLLLLDEFLEFKPRIQEALREPLEEGLIRIARAGKMEIFPARSLCVATTNLCPCGDFIPGQREKALCHFTRSRCQSYSKRLSGPLLDRFHVLFFSELGARKEVSLQEIFAKVERARAFQKRLKAEPAAWRAVAEIEETLSDFWKVRRNEMRTSERRKNAVLRVARTLADIEGVELMSATAWNQAHQFCVAPFERMKKWDL